MFYFSFLSFSSSLAEKSRNFPSQLYISFFTLNQLAEWIHHSISSGSSSNHTWPFVLIFRHSPRLAARASGRYHQLWGALVWEKVSKNDIVVTLMSNWVQYLEDNNTMWSRKWASEAKCGSAERHLWLMRHLCFWELWRGVKKHMCGCFHKRLRASTGNICKREVPYVEDLLSGWGWNNTTEQQTSKQ